MLFKSTDSNDPRTVSLLESLIKPLPDPNNLWIPVLTPSGVFTGSPLTYEQALYKVASVFLDDINIDLDQLCKRTIRSSPPSISREQNIVLVDLCKGPCGTSADLCSRFLVSLCSELLGKYNYRLLTLSTGDNGSAIANACTELQGSLPATVLYSNTRISADRYDYLHKLEDNEYRVIPMSHNGNHNECTNDFLQLLYRQDAKYIAANSVNFIYMIPMIAYYAWIALKLPNHKIYIPAGVCSEILAARTARAMGAPLGHIHCTYEPIRFTEKNGAKEPSDIQKKNMDPTTIVPFLDVNPELNLLRLKTMFPMDSTLPDDILDNISWHPLSDIDGVLKVMNELSLDILSAISYVTFTMTSALRDSSVPNSVIPILSKQRLSKTPTGAFCSAINGYSQISTKKSVILVGMPGSGKTTLCKNLGGIDNDDLIVSEHGPLNDFLLSCDSVETFFLSEGVIMRKLIDSINTGERSGVIATGGSIVHDPQTVEALKKMDDSVIIIWLYTTDKTRGRNMDRGVAWPGGVQSWEDLEELRYPLYENVSHIKLCTNESISKCTNILNSLLCRSTNQNIQCDYSTFAPFRLSVSSRSCMLELLRQLTEILIEMKYDTKITMNTTINDGIVEPGFDILFTALAHSASADLKQLTTREHILIIWPRISSLLGLRCAYFEMFGRFSGCIHSFLLTKCPGAYPIR